MSETLKPCPFSHEIKRGPSVEIEDEEWNVATVICGDCGTRGPYVDLDDYGGKDAAAHAAKLLWNQRGCIFDERPNPDGEEAAATIESLSSKLEAAREGLRHAEQHLIDSLPARAILRIREVRTILSEGDA